MFFKIYSTDMYLETSPHDVIQGQFSKRDLASLNSEFSSPRLVAIT